MSCLMEIKDSQSERLLRIASEKGVMPDVLLEEALELLFQQADRENAMQEELAFLKRLKTECEDSPWVHTRPPFDTEAVTITHVVPVDAAMLHRHSNHLSS